MWQWNIQQVNMIDKDFSIKDESIFVARLFIAISNKYWYIDLGAS